jgi:hypothetical protein
MQEVHDLVDTNKPAPYAPINIPKGITKDDGDTDKAPSPRIPMNEQIIAIVKAANRKGMTRITNAQIAEQLDPPRKPTAISSNLAILVEQRRLKRPERTIYMLGPDADIWKPTKSYKKKAKAGKETAKKVQHTSPKVVGRVVESQTFRASLGELYEYLGKTPSGRIVMRQLDDQTIMIADRVDL